MLSASHQSVLDQVYDRLAGRDLEWAVTQASRWRCMAWR